jgi:hypothetical protein
MYLGLKPPGRGGGDADHSHRSSAEFKNGGAIPPLSHTSGHRDIFTVFLTPLAHFPYFEEIRARLMRSVCCLCVCVYPTLTNFRISEPFFMKLWYLNGVLCKSLSQVCVYPSISLLGNGSADTFLRQQIHATIKFLEASFSMRSVSYQRKAGH